MNYGYVVENALLSIDLNFWIGTILVDGQTISLPDYDQITVFRLHISAAEQDATIGDTVLVIAMALCNNTEAVSDVDALKALDADGVVLSNRELMGCVCVNFRQQYGSPPQ